METGAGAESTSLLIGEMPLEAPDMAGAMSFLPKLSRLLETLLDTLLMFRGAGLAVALQEERGGQVMEGNGGKKCTIILCVCVYE